MAASGDTNTLLDWQLVMGRALGILCLHAEELRGAPLVDQWFFLERLGFPRDEAAKILGTTAESLRVSGARRKAQPTKTKTSPKAK